MIRLILCIILIFLFMLYSIFDAVVFLILTSIDKSWEDKRYKYHSMIIRFIFRCFIFIAGVKLHIKGLENIIDENEPLFIVANHRGFFDIIIGYTLLKRPCTIIAKESLLKVPFLGYWMKNIGCIGFDRNDIRQGMQMVITSISKLKSGISVWVFPEGTRNKNDDYLRLLEFKSGAFKIAEKADAKVLPISFAGTENVLEKHVPFIRVSDVYVSVGKVFKMSDVPTDVEKGVYAQNIILELLKKIKVGNH